MSVPFAVLRHASTDWNVERRLQGTTDTPLNAAGEADARTWRLPSPADGWKRLSSPLQRARRTAELRQSVGAAFIAAENKGLDFQPPGGESPRAAMARIGRWTASIAAVGQPVVAVSHKATIRALLALATGWDMMGRPPHKLDWRRLHFFSAHVDGRVTVDRLNVPL